MGIGRVELPFIGVSGIEVSGSGVFDYLVSAELICYSSEHQVSMYWALCFDSWVLIIVFTQLRRGKMFERWNQGLILIFALIFKSEHKMINYDMWYLFE